MRLDEYLATTPPRCLSGFRPVSADPEIGDAGWRLRCLCGSEKGAILGHPLGSVKPGFEGWKTLVSPMTFRCAGCGRQTPLLDTAEHGEGSEHAKREGWEVGCAAYRGEGEGEPTACPECASTRVTALVSLSYHDDRIADFWDDPHFPLADYFDGFTLHCECSVCGCRWEASRIDTK
jgi:hypothetical protein